MQIAEGALAIPPSAFGALGALGVIGAALFVADPEKRCDWMAVPGCPYTSIFSPLPMLLLAFSVQQRLDPSRDAAPGGLG